MMQDHPVRASDSDRGVHAIRRFWSWRVVESPDAQLPYQWSRVRGRAVSLDGSEPSRFPEFRGDQEHVRVLLVLHPVADGGQHNNVFQQKPAFCVSVKGGFSILRFHLALTGTSFAPPGSAEDGRYAALRAARSVGLMQCA
jgi:hypothetical protein